MLKNYGDTILNSFCFTGSRIKYCVPVIVFFILAQGAGYALGGLSLESLLKEAKEKNPEILAAKKRYAASLARVPQAKSLDNPALGFTFKQIPKGTLKLNKTMPVDRMLSISQMFPSLGKLSLKGKIALVESQMTAAEYKAKELEVINKVKNAYYGLFLNLKERELNEQSLKFLEGISGIAEARYATGELMQEEVLKIHSEIATLSNNIMNLKQEESAKKTQLAVLLNKEPERAFEIMPLEESVSFNKDINSLYQLTLENHPELLAFSYAIEKNKYAESLAKKSFFPDLMAGVIQRGIASGAIGPWDLMLSFSVPFWFWTKQRYELKEAIANLEEAKAAYESMRNKTLSETKDLASSVEIAKNKINLSKASLIPVLENSIESSLAGFRSGRGDAMMLLDSIRMLIEARMSYYKSLVEYNINLADLERAVGGNL